jgi:hypothetical protein
MPERRVEEIREEIGTAREDFAMMVDEIVNQRRKARQQLQRHPVGYTLGISGVSMAVGLLFGTLFGRMLGRRRIRQPRLLVRV